MTTNDGRGSYRFMTIPAAEGRLAAADNPVTEEQLSAARKAALKLLKRLDQPDPDDYWIIVR